MLTLRRIMPYILIVCNVIMLMTLGFVFMNSGTKQIRNAMLILLIIIIVIDLITATIKITIGGMFLKVCVFSLIIGFPVVVAFVVHEYNLAVGCAGASIGALGVINIFFYAWEGNRSVSDLYETSEPGLVVYKAEYQGFNDFLTLPKNTYISFIINAPAKILIMVLSIFIATKATYVEGEGYYNYWDTNVHPWEYKTGQRKVFIQDSLDLVGTIYFIFAGIYLLVFIILFFLSQKKNLVKEKPEEN